MEIVLDKRAVKQIRLSAADAIEEGDTETLREDVIQVFTDEQVEEIERRIDSGDFYDFLSEILDEWSAEDADELFELLEAQLSEAGIDLKLAPASGEEEEEAAEPDGEADADGEPDSDADADDDDDDDDLDLDDEKEEEEL